METLSPAIALAIIEDPPEVSVVTAAIRADLHDKALRAQHGAAVDELLELERAIEIAGGAVEVGRDEIRVDVGVNDPHEFDRLAAPHEANAGPVPWLRKDGEKVFTVDIARLTTALATEEDIAGGRYFNSLEEFRTANPVGPIGSNGSAL